MDKIDKNSASYKALGSFANEISEGRRLQKFFSDIYGVPLEDLQYQEKYETESKTPYEVYSGFYEPGKMADYRETVRPVEQVYTGAGDVMMLRKPMYEALLNVLGRK